MVKKYKVIFLDQDGVLAAFTSAVIEQVNSVTGSNVTLDRAIKESNWDLEKLWDMSQADWWQAIDKNETFWLDIPMFSWAKTLHNNLKEYANEVVILTSPSQNPNCISQKITWLYENMQIPSRNIITAKKKYLLANNDTLLIDDSGRNCSEFIKHGGEAICIPSDWNTADLSFEKVWGVIEEYIKK